jgi:GGDEF-like domain/PucR C-terminal helix-turn-helix domain
MMAPMEERLVAIVAALADRLEAEWSTGYLERLNSLLPQIASVPGLSNLLRKAADEHAVAIASLLRAEGDDPLVEVRASSGELFRRLVEVGLPLDVLMRSYPLAQAELTSWWIEHVADVVETVADQTALTCALVESCSRYMQFSAERLSQVYAEEYARRSRSLSARKAQLVDRVIRGDAIDQDTAASQLGHALAGWQTAVVVWDETATDESPPLTRLEVAAQLAADALGGRGALTIAPARGGLWAWIATRSRPDVDALDDGLLDSIDGVRLAVGDPAEGLDGFRTSHHEALAAQRVAVLGGGRVTLYREVEVASIATRDLGAARRLVARELGALSADGESTERLRVVLRVYLAAGLNARAAGERLHMHRNTVLYHVRHAEQLLGHPVGDRLFELELALRLVRDLGQTVSCS